MMRDDWRGDTVFDREPESRSLGLILKISERCNLTCSYCYFFFGGDESYKQNSPTMKPGVVGDVVRFLVEATRRYRLKVIHISLHGGEPLLMRKAAFGRMCQAFREALDPLCKLRILIQTNGVLIDQEWLEIFARHRVGVGVSFDGDQAAHDVYRLDKKGRGTYAQSRRGWEMLKAAAARRRVSEPGILCVVSPDRSGAGLYDHFARELGATFINFLLPDHCHEDQLAVGFVEGCATYLKDVFHAWTAHDPMRVNVRFIAEAYLALLNDDYARARRTRGHDATQLLIIRSTGEITPVDKLSTVSPRLASTGLNVGSATLEDVLGGEVWSDIRQACESVPVECEGCAWQYICRGGPLNTRFSRERGFDNASIYCSAYQSLYTEIARTLAASGVSWDAMNARMTGRYAAPRDEARIRRPREAQGAVPGGVL